MTKEEAEFEVERCRVEAILLKYGRREFKYDEKNYQLSYVYDDYRIDIDGYAIYQNQGAIYFDTEELCLKAIDEAGEDNIKKYIFGVDSK